MLSLTPSSVSVALAVSSMLLSGQGCHLAFLKQFARNKMIWLFLAFLNLDQNSIFLSLFGKFPSKCTSFYDIPKII
jgi:hypothetical protein